MPAAEAMVPVSDRGFMYGDGLFETTRVVNGRPFRLAQHLERMVRGADVAMRMGIPSTWCGNVMTRRYRCHVSPSVPRRFAEVTPATGQVDQE